MRESTQTQNRNTMTGQVCVCVCVCVCDVCGHVFMCVEACWDVISAQGVSSSSTSYFNTLNRGEENTEKSRMKEETRLRELINESISE